MVLETEIYGTKSSLFKSICDLIPEIKLYHVSPDYGSDLNTNNLNTFVKDEKYGLVSLGNRYPICLCITPRSYEDANTLIETFIFNIFFLQQSYVKSIDKDTNSSAQLIEDDWSEMKVIANKFISELKIRSNWYYTGVIRWGQIFGMSYQEKIIIKRLSRYSQDRVSGVGITFYANFNSLDC